ILAVARASGALPQPDGYRIAYEDDQIEEAARDAECALNGPGREFEELKGLGESHVAQEDPQIGIRLRAYAIWEEEGRPNGRHIEHWQRAEEEAEPRAD